MAEQDRSPRPVAREHSRVRVSEGSAGVKLRVRIRKWWAGRVPSPVPAPPSPSSQSSRSPPAHRTRSRTSNTSGGNSQSLFVSSLLPLDDRDYAHSPYSEETIDYADSDHSLYSPTRRASQRRSPLKRRTTSRGASVSATSPKRRRSEQTTSFISTASDNIRSTNRSSAGKNTTRIASTATSNLNLSLPTRGKSATRGRPLTRGNHSNTNSRSVPGVSFSTSGRKERESIGEGGRGVSRRGNGSTVDNKRNYSLRSRGSLPARDNSVSSSASEGSTFHSSANSLRAEASSTVSNLTTTSLSSSDIRTKLRHSSRIPQPINNRSHSLLSLQISPTRRRTGSAVSVSNNLGARLGRRSGGAVQSNASPPPPKRESGRGGRGRTRGSGADMPQQTGGGTNNINASSNNNSHIASGVGNNNSGSGGLNTNNNNSRGRTSGRGPTSLGSCASSGGGGGGSGGRRGTAGGATGAHQTTATPSTQHPGAVASTSSSNQQNSGLAANMTGGASNLDGKSKAKGLGEESAGGSNIMAGADPASASGNTCGNAGASVGESSSDDSEVGRLRALLEARGLPPHLLGALGPRVQHLLHRTMGATTSSKAARLLAGLQATGDEGQQLQAVIEMCQLLVMGNEDTLAGFPVRQVVTALIQLLGMEHNFDMMNHACRALTYMMEALPHTSGAVAQAVPAFLDKLKAITCMDVAEQSLTALDMLSRRHSKPILQARGVQACLMYLDFFSINAQRAALSITSNCCQNLSAEEFLFIRDSLPLLASRLTQQDKKSVESVCLAFSRLVESYQSDPMRLQEIASSELLTNLQSLLVVSPPMVSTATFITVLRMLSTMCSSCPELAVTLLKQNIADTLLYLLTGSTVANPQEEVELVSRSPPELYEITCLIAELMPHLPSTGLFTVDSCLERPWGVAPTAQHLQPQWQWRDDTGVWHAYTTVDSRIIEAAHQSSEDEVSLSALGRTYIVDFLSMKQINEDTGTTRPVQRRVHSQPPNQQQADQQGASAVRCTDARSACVRGTCGKRLMALCSVLLEVYSSSAGPAVRCQCLKALLRMVYHAEPDMLTWGLKYQVISSQVAGMMASNDLRVVVGSLQMAEILMEKLPDVFGTHFRREGVMHQIRQLADPSVPLCVSPPKSVPRVSSPKRDPHVDLQSVLPSKTKGGLLTGVVKGTNSMAGIVAPSVVNVNLAPGTSHATHQLFTTATTSVSIEATTVTSAIATETQQLTEIPLPSTVAPEPHRTQSPVSVRISDVLKRKRAPKRSDRGGAGSGSGASSGVGSGRHRRQEDPQHDHHPHGSSFRSRLGGATSKTTSFLASLNPARWARQHGAPSVLGAISRDSLQSSANIAAQNREKARQWVRTKAAALSSEQGIAGGRGSAATTHPVLARLTAAVQRLSSQDPTPALLQLRDVLVDSDISPFEVNHSGLVGALLTFLTAPSDEDTQELVARDCRLRTFLNIFANMPLDIDAVEPLLNYNPSSLSALVNKISACISQLEQFPVRVHDLPARPSTSALKFFNTHQLKCNLQRHPNCTNLKQWKGGTVKIDPLALVQAIERYLVVRGYARQRDSSGGSSGAPHQQLQDSDEDNTDEDMDDSLAAVAVSQGRSKHKLQFMIGDTILPYNMTVYQAVRQYSPQANDQSETDTDTEAPLGNASIWVQTHTIYYRGVGSDNGMSSGLGGQSSTAGVTSGGGSTQLGRKGKGTSTKVNNRRKADDLWNDGIVPATQSALNRVLGRTLPATVSVHDAALPALALLRCLHGISRHWTCLYRACPQITRALLLQTDFVNSKLAAKASRQLQDPLVIMTGNLPQWLHQIASACPFLFPFETRQLLFYAVSFDRDRALQRLLDSSPELNNASSDSAERVMPRLDRRKRTVSRDHILKQAEQVVQDFAHSKALLEIKYENEVGTGLGPTLEFYALVSLELQRADLDLWHGSENFKQKPSSFGVDIVKNNQAVVIDDTADSPPPMDPAATLASSVYNNLNINEERNRNVQNANQDQQYDSLDMPMIVDPADVNLNNEVKDNHPPSPVEVSYVNLPCGLFPQSLGRNTKASQLSKIKAKFRFLGKFMAKAVMDSRMLDLPFSQTMYRWVVGEESCLGLGDVRHVAPELWRSLCRLQQVALHAETIKKDTTISQERRRELLVSLELDGCPIEELGLDFILPGHSCIELRRGGRDTPVTAANLLQYIQLVTHWLLYEGVNRQMDAFREGFESVFPLNNLRMFYPEELEAIFCGTTSNSLGGSAGSQRWDVRTLAEAIKPDHGFTSESKAIRFLLEILSSYDTTEQRMFLQFITGSPRLPTGGFKSLSPPLTVVRKTLDPDVNGDDYLPSVMTCLNYLKLPDYSSIEVMRAKLRIASNEGQHSFHLS